MDKLFNKIGHFIIKHAKVNIIVILAVTVFLAFGATKLDMKMGNDVFVSSKSDVYKDTTTYQKNFGGDGIYLLLEGDKDKLISHETAQKITTFSEKATKIEAVTGASNYISLMNEMLASNNPSAGFNMSGDSKLSESIQKAIPAAKMKKIESDMQASLSANQSAKIQEYMQSLLTDPQKMTVGQQIAGLGAAATPEQQAGIVQSTLTPEQRQKVEAYTQSILTKKQSANMQEAVIKAMPKIQDMDNSLLRQIVFSDKGKIPTALEKIIPNNGGNVLIMLNTSDDTEMDTAVHTNEELKKLVKNTDFGDGITVKLAGGPIIQGDVQGEVMTTMTVMLSLSVVLMIVVLLVVFPVRRRVISLGFVLIGLIWTFGFMGWVGIPITLATMATLPIIIGLGTDFGVQFHNRYEEEFKKSDYKADEATVTAIRHIGPAVGIAVAIMALSFLTMFLSKAPMMQQFGLTLALGVIFCYIVELVLMFSTFNMMDKKKKKGEVKIKNNDETWLSRGLGSYAKLVGKFAAPILIVGVILAGIGFSVEKSIPTETNMMKMIPQEMKALQNTNYLQETVGSTTFISYLVEADDVTQPEVVSWMKTFGDEVKGEFKDVTGVTSVATYVEDIEGKGTVKKDNEKLPESVSQLPKSVQEMVVSKNKHYATLQFQIDNNLSSADQLALLNKITAKIDAGKDISVKPAGAQVMMLFGIDNIGANSNLMIGAGLLIIFVGLFLVYRRVKHAIYPIIPILLVLGFSPLLLKMLGMSYNPLTTALSCLVLGIGTEFTILIMERFREEEAKGLATKEAIHVSLSKVGQAITVSGLTVIVGFSTLMFVSFPILRDFGITTVLDTLLCLICALTVLPALIILFRKR
ncbi:putative export protein [Brochothrix thermosphacta]|uniref:efflux RND transporter permease subunit n=1 Tax=Brochothrix thermosphacta TaxID=2756 RepID=UPI00083FA09A|nr:hydrophobe/amphiphile efflux-3 (HAE3) family transporter [Brochothrix thermosphacta]ODJ68673.1 hypothetical protein BFR37_00145 [Brochothrix thermosphacta]SPN72950.1 putative export protein [Brochothrix thermosphacta]